MHRTIDDAWIDDSWRGVAKTGQRRRRVAIAAPPAYLLGPSLSARRLTADPELGSNPSDPMTRTYIIDVLSFHDMRQHTRPSEDSDDAISNKR